MHLKQKQLPLEVSSWMQKDITLRAPNSNALNNDMRRNIVLSRQFFANTLNLSYDRYRMMAKSEFDKKLFLKKQQFKAETGMPGLKNHLEVLAQNLKEGITPSLSSPTPSLATTKSQSEPFLSSSSQSFHIRSFALSDPTFNAAPRRKQSLRKFIGAGVTSRRTHGLVPSPSISPTLSETISASRPTSSRQQMSRERLNRLAQPKGYRPKSGLGAHIRVNMAGAPLNAQQLFGKIDEVSEVSTVHAAHQQQNGGAEAQPTATQNFRTPSAVMYDKRFRRLMNIFAETYDKTSLMDSVESIVSANKSLQDSDGSWQMNSSRAQAVRLEQAKQHRKRLAQQFATKTDFFYIDVGA